jgi:hypothetical protein
LFADRGVLVIVAEEILTYLDFESLNNAAEVSNVWNKVITNSQKRSSLMEKCTKVVKLNILNLNILN